MTPPGRDGSDAARLEAVVRGLVQGVGFRVFIVRRATRLGLTGWVANEADGSVRCVAEGRRPDLEQLEAILRRGPAGASVREARVTWGPARGGFADFGVRSGSHPGD
jgi:acylphosphatase